MVVVESVLGSSVYLMISGEEKVGMAEKVGVEGKGVSRV